MSDLMFGSIQTVLKRRFHPLMIGFKRGKLSHRLKDLLVSIYAKQTIPG